MTKTAVEMVKVESSLGFYNPLFLVPKLLPSDLGSEHLKHISQGQKVQNGDTNLVNSFRFCKSLKGNVWQRLKNDGYENHL